nr:retrovirus-related Pol polyprotein from transposon TNT 1-94 [Tanacetum cinerariifolium]GEZ77088.1 retrovirus-related Pol polyprotein from transposon TNT 1-94 [Tanacetum cinerariifolium]
DSYEDPGDVATTVSASDGTGKKKERIVTLTTNDMQKRKNDARTTLLLSLPDEHQLRFRKYKTAQELWAAVLKTFDGNEATKKTKKNLLKQQYGNFKAEGSETLEQTSDLDTMSLDDLYNYLKKTGKKISIQGTNVAGFDMSKVECFNCHKMGYFARECRAPRSQDSGRRDNYRQGSKVKEQAPNALMAIDGVGWDWSYMENDKESHALIAGEETPTEFALMAKTSAESEVFDNSLCFKAYKKNSDSLNSKITELTDKLCDAKNMIYHYKLGLAQVEARLAEHRNQELKYCEKIRVLEFKTKSMANCIESLTKDLELLKKDKGKLETKLTGFQTASKDLDSLLESQRLDKNKEGLGYSVVPPPPAQVYSLPKKDMSWTCLPEFKDDTVTDYSRPSPAIESTLDNAQNRNPSVTETEASPSTISPKPFIKFVKANDIPTKRVKKGRTCPSNSHKTTSPRIVIHKPYRPPMRPIRPNMNAAQPNRTSFYKPTHSYTKRPSQRTSAVRSQYRCPRVPPVSKKFSTVNRKFPTANRKFSTGGTKFSTADMGKKGKSYNLGKFEAKGDEGYFIGYSMSSKAFRVYNKRTKRVEENLHVDFLENKAIEKGVGPNWLFDIDSLIKSINYVPVVVAGTNSTNFSGTKDAARQEMKKDVSSLRYIVLPNWIHEVHLESSSSQPQETCNTDVPESSRNSNPTATSTNPSADQIETLTVETLIPTVSSLVPSVCLNDSLEPSSDTRLISKRVANQVETPSLDNILTLTNRLEDILGVTTYSDESNGVEADVSNMEITITASPTPTLRIHKDHPKSQIIAYASFLGFTVYQMDVKSAFIYGTIDKEVYVMQPLGFQDSKFPAKVYKVEKTMYGLH